MMGYAERDAVAAIGRAVRTVSITQLIARANGRLRFLQYVCPSVYVSMSSQLCLTSPHGYGFLRGQASQVKPTKRALVPTSPRKPGTASTAKSSAGVDKVGSSF